VSVTSPPSPALLRRLGLDPTWSSEVTFTGSDGRPVTWHYLDTGRQPETTATLVCVHGNPTWSYLWRGLLEQLPPTWRVIAVDQTGMGFSERNRPRRYADRVDELVTFCRTVADGPLALAAHDWGGAIAMGAAPHLPVTHLVLSNTAIAKPDGVAVPPLIAVARRFAGLICQYTWGFVEGTALMTERRHRAALRAPYRGAARRSAVAEFVADIPVRPSDPSFAALAAAADALEGLVVPTLLVFGVRDPVFHDRFLADLHTRLPHASVERIADCGHLAPLDASFPGTVAAWLTETPAIERPVVSEDRPPGGSVYDTIEHHVDDAAVILGIGDHQYSWSTLATKRAIAASVLQEHGIGVGDKVAVLVQPGLDLLVAVAALWAVGAVPVVADLTGGLRQLRRLHRAAASTAVIGSGSALAMSAVLGLVPGAKRFATDGRFGIDLQIGETLPASRFARLGPDGLAAIVHTSGATGPAKAVRYTHGALAAQRDILQRAFPIGEGATFTTSFAPFLLLAPALERTCLLADIAFDQPGQLTSDHLVAMEQHSPIDLAWLSPAGARGVTTNGTSTPTSLRRVLLAGAPIPESLRQAVALRTSAVVDAPYGMTECLPITTGAPAPPGPHGGYPTGVPLEGCSVVIAQLDNPLADAAEGAVGEILVAAPWMFDGYDQRWTVNVATTVHRSGRRFHRTGDVGYLHNDNLYHLGRLQHVLWTSTGPLSSVAVEQPIEQRTGMTVAAVGIGPRAVQVIALVVGGTGKLRLAPPNVADSVRAGGSHPIAAVLTGELPLDRRHRSKIDRTALARAANRLLSGR